MKYLFIVIAFTGGIITLNAQTTRNSNSAGSRKTQTSGQGTNGQQKGNGQYHGSRDTTPGSPMGTGGAGGDMSGSPAASAIETDDQTVKAQVKQDTSEGAAAVKKSTTRKTKQVYRAKKRPQ